VCDHKWVPYIMLATHPKGTMGGSDVYVMAQQVHSLITVKVRCVECGEERDLELGEDEKTSLSLIRM